MPPAIGLLMTQILVRFVKRRCKTSAFVWSGVFYAYLSTPSTPINWVESLYQMVRHLMHGVLWAYNFHVVAVLERQVSQLALKLTPNHLAEVLNYLVKLVLISSRVIPCWMPFYHLFYIDDHWS